VYCGALATLDQRSCPKCRQSLMIRAQARTKRSIPLTITGILWILSGVLQTLGGLASTAIGLIAYTTLQSQAKRLKMPSPPFPTQMLVPLAAGLVAGVLLIMIGRGLLKRARWAYFVVAVLTMLGLLATGAVLLLGAAALPALFQALKASAASSARSGETAASAILGASIMASLTISFGLQVLFALLVGLSHRDFYGPMVRYQPDLASGTDMDNYNSAVAYKRRGMWYMAAQEWEAAVKQKPGDPVYLHALGLAHLQLKQFDQARDALDRAIAIAPGETQIKQSREAVDHLDKSGKKR
jgi:tetratricopeptide (TPR) repeat protein